jgi:putative photosynthetic complex assembly protein 2
VSELIIPGIVAAFAWWFSTGVILYLDGLPRRTFRWSMLGASVLMIAALFGLHASSGNATVAAAYCSFFCGLAIWGWQETAFLLGYVTGPGADAEGERATGWRHFLDAVRAILYHELAILAGACVVVAITWDAPNQVGTWTFLALWALRLSAKLNLFLGVRNLNEDWIPEHLAFVKRFLTRRPMNVLFPFSICLATAATIFLVGGAIAPDASDFETTAFALLAMLVALAILEHWLMVLPINTDVLWAWGLRSHRGRDDSDRSADALRSQELKRIPFACLAASDGGTAGTIRQWHAILRRQG